jgi:hypothetical protein
MKGDADSIKKDEYHLKILLDEVKQHVVVNFSKSAINNIQGKFSELKTFVTMLEK